MVLYEPWRVDCSAAELHRYGGGFSAVRAGGLFLFQFEPFLHWPRRWLVGELPPLVPHHGRD